MRLIDADVLIAEINNRIEAAVKWGVNAIADHDQDIKLRAEQAIATFCEASLTAKRMPTVDAVEVVRCRDCQWYEIYQLKRDGTEDRRYRPSYCASLSYQTRPDWYCADGERRTNGEVTEC